VRQDNDPEGCEKLMLAVPELYPLWSTNGGLISVAVDARSGWQFSRLREG